VEDLINDFERILTMSLPQPAMASSSQANNQVSDLIAHIVNTELNPLRNREFKSTNKSKYKKG